MSMIKFSCMNVTSHTADTEYQPHRASDAGRGATESNPTHHKRRHQYITVRTNVSQAFISCSQMLLPHKFIRELDFRPALKLLW